MSGAIGLAIIVLAAAGWALLRVRARIARLEAQIRNLRTLAGRAITHRVLAPGELASQVAELDGSNGEIATAGLRVLGDVVEDTMAEQPMRWFATADGAVWGMIAILPQHRRRVVQLFTRKGDDVSLTRVAGTAVALASPPFIHRHEIALGTSLDQALADHRAFAEVGDGSGCTHVTSVDQAIAELAALRGRTMAWREQQPPADLLDRDLRGILGAHYERLGTELTRRLAADPLPRADVHKS